jgi:hypothetical protein
MHALVEQLLGRTYCQPQRQRPKQGRRKSCRTLLMNLFSMIIILLVLLVCCSLFCRPRKVVWVKEERGEPVTVTVTVTVTEFPFTGEFVGLLKK